MPVWRNPAAWFGLAALAIPIAVHLLARARARVIAFPSLRFIEISRLAARKRRTLSDVTLLALRLLALLLAIAALADPLFLTASRRTAWSSRVSRAVVIDTSASMSRGRAAETATLTAQRELRDTFRATTVRAPSLRDGVAWAAAWLRSSAPSRREVVVISDFQPDTVSPALLRDVPDDIGLRFIRVGAPVRELDADTRAVSTPGLGPNTFEWRRAQVHVTENATAIGKQTSVALPAMAITRSDAELSLAPFAVRVSVAQPERAVALATLQAVLAEGVPAPTQTPIQPLRQTDRSLQMNRQVELELGAAPPKAGGPETGFAPLSAPWMAEALDRIASDRSLADAIARTPGTSVTGGGATPLAPWRVVLADAHGEPALLAATRIGAAQGPELVLRARLSASAPETPLLFRAVLRALAASDNLPEAEVRIIPDSVLAAWSRPAAEPSMQALRDVEDSDRRWLWAAVLALLLVEVWVRRDRQRAAIRIRVGGDP